MVGNAGWFIRRKRFNVFLNVAAQVAQRESRSVFAIAGGGEEEPQLRKLAEELGIGEKVRWLGWLDDLSGFRDSLDVLLFNSDWDALGLTPHESVARGVPLVTSVVNGVLREVLDDETGSRVLEDHNVDELAHQILAMRHDPPHARASAERCREHLLRLTNPATIAEAYFELLQIHP